MGIFIEVKLKGEKEKAVKMLANSGSDLIVLTKKLAEEIKPRETGNEVEIVKVGGEKEKKKLYEVEAEVADPETREKRRETGYAIISEEQDIPLLGYEIMEKLGILLDIKKGKFRLV